MNIKNIYKVLITLVSFVSVILSQGYNMQLMSQFSFNENTSDITGFAQDGREFAVVGLQNSAAFVDITDPYSPFEVGRISGGNSIWRDLKYWDRHVYIGTEASDGVKVVNVDDLDNPTLVYTISDFTNSHNIHIDADGFLYVVGASQYDVWIYDLTNPASPNLVGTWNGEYCHDIEVYNNKLYCAAIYSGYFYIVDVSDKSNPLTLVSHFTGSSGISTHDVAVTPDEHYLFTGDENTGGHIKVFDILDYSNINLVAEWTTPDWQTHSAHNLYWKDDLLYISYYADGIRVLDVSDPTNPTEIAYYDTCSIEGLYVGNWGVYVYLPSGNIIASDIETGLYVTQLGGISINHEPIGDLSYNQSDISINASVTAFSGSVESVNLNFKSLDEPYMNWVTIPMESIPSVSFDSYQGFIPNPGQGTILAYYITAVSTEGQISNYPTLGEDNPITFIFGDLEQLYSYDFEILSNDWYVESTASTGTWIQAIPAASYSDDGSIVQTGNAYSGNQCFVTGNSNNAYSPGDNDVDGGVTTLLSPNFNLYGETQVILTYYKWYTNNKGANPGTESWKVDVSNNGGASWVSLENTSQSNTSWEQKRFILNQIIELTNEMRFRFIAEDSPNNQGCLVEAAVDYFKLEKLSDDNNVLPGDLNYDLNIDVLDIVAMINLILSETEPTNDELLVGDLNLDYSINIQDIIILVNIILE